MSGERAGEGAVRRAQIGRISMAMMPVCEFAGESLSIEARKGT